jgi:hypothetical protein
MDKARALLGAMLGIVLAGCAAWFDAAIPEANAPEPPLGFTGCEAESYDFVGEGTLAGLGLDEATPVPPPDPDRPARIWVTHDLLPYDRGEPGGPVEMTRMLCFEFEDGSGGSEWPVDPSWQPPGQAAPNEAQGIAVPSALLLLGLVVLLAVGVSVVAFRRRG